MLFLSGSAGGSAFVMSGTGFGMIVPTTQRIHRRAPLGSLNLLAGFALILASSFANPLQAAESISAYLDATGRVVFVNEGDAPTRAARNTTARAAKGDRHVIASSTPGAVSPESSAPSDALMQPLSAEPVPDENSLNAEPPDASNLDSLIEQAANRHQIDPELVRAIVRVESNFDPYAVSPAGARGLMQLIPSTAMRFGVRNPFDPRANLDGGIRYLKYLLGMYGGDLQLTLAAYNAGEDAVARSRGVPPIRETQNYIRKVGEIYPLRFVPTGAAPVPEIMKYVDRTGVVHFSNTDLP